MRLFEPSRTPIRDVYLSFKTSSTNIVPQRELLYLNHDQDFHHSAGNVLPSYVSMIVPPTPKKKKESSEAQVVEDSVALQIETRQRHPEYPLLRPSLEIATEVSEYSRRLRLYRPISSPGIDLYCS